MQKKYTLRSQEIPDFKTVMFPTFPDMKFGIINGSLYFNATKLMESANPPQSGDKKNPAQLAIDFTGKLGYIVDSLVDMYGLKPDETFYYSQDKDLIVDAVLDTTFLGFVFPAVLTESMDSCRDILIHNFAISDSVLMSMASRKLPDEAINEIIKARK